MEEAAIVVLVLVLAVAALSALARGVGLPYPIVLVIGGLLIGVVPGVPAPVLNPALVFLVFLPPLLYFAAFQASLRDLRADLRAIALLAFGLVLVTTAAVAGVARLLVPELPWAAAFALGAIVSPTDPIAASAIMRRLGAPRRVVTVLEGESLVNDATALVVLGLAIAAAGGAGVSWWEAGLRLPLTAGGGVAIGLAVGWLLARIRQRLDDPPVEVTLSLVAPFAAYLPAEELGASGVLAAVAAGLYVGWRGPALATARTRLALLGVWEFVVFIGNAVLFILVGLQLPAILGTGAPLTRSVGVALAVAALVIGLRLLWLFTVPYLVRALDRRPQQRARRSPWRERLVVGWSGMRGAVSLAAALSLPRQVGGEPFPERELLILVAFVVVLVTLLVQGLSLPALIRRLGVHDDGSEAREEVLARRRAAEAAIARIDALAAEDWTRPDTLERLRGLYEFRRRRFAIHAGDEPDDDGIDDRSLAYQRLVRLVLQAQRDQLVELRDRGVIGNDVLQRVMRDLDLEDSRLEI